MMDSDASVKPIKHLTVSDTVPGNDLWDKVGNVIYSFHCQSIPLKDQKPTHVCFVQPNPDVSEFSCARAILLKIHE